MCIVSQLSTLGATRSRVTKESQLFCVEENTKTPVLNLICDILDCIAFSSGAPFVSKLFKSRDTYISIGRYKFTMLYVIRQQI